MKPSIWQRAAKRFEDGVEEFGCCSALWEAGADMSNNADDKLDLVFRESRSDVYYFGFTKAHNHAATVERIEAANNHRIIALLLMHELERTGDLKKIIEQEKRK